MTFEILGSSTGDLNGLVASLPRPLIHTTLLDRVLPWDAEFGEDVLRNSSPVRLPLLSARFRVVVGLSGRDGVGVGPRFPDAQPSSAASFAFSKDGQ